MTSNRTCPGRIARYAGLMRDGATPAIVLVWLGGCALQPPAVMAWGPPNDKPTAAVAVGDWDDVDAAVRTALRDCQLAREARRAFREEEGGDETLLEYDLLTVRGDSGLLRVRRLGDGSLGLQCRIGVLGSAEAERCVIEHLTARLADLHGVDYAPIRE